jgi:sulfatase maturation enzyme AslB (radical SAM superfamily)
MAHPEFGNILKYFKEVDIHTGVTTNGTLLDRHMDECVKTEWLRVSVDAGSEEVFAQFRPHRSGKSQFNRVINNMREFAKVKNGLLGYSFLILNMHDHDGNLTATNAIDIARAAELALSIGCDYFEVKPAFDLMHFLQKQDDEVVRIVNEQLEQIHSLKSEHFNVIAPFTLDEALGGATTQIKPYSRCLTAELRTVVSPSGTYVCPYHRGNLNMRIGDATKQDLLQIWDSPRRLQVMEHVDPQKHCSFHCIRHESNLLLEQMMAGDVVDTVPDFDRFI